MYLLPSLKILYYDLFLLKNRELRSRLARIRTETDIGHSSVLPITCTPATGAVSRGRSSLALLPTYSAAMQTCKA
ncbi:unnamed protein product [Protopolystoma xenopodis]|uniref:Uncharacterized protein n=1 Tax=Protopolystoma xenopodis TaxID=117903 RepID=A0A3S5CJX3_9PLAT|nr:unnamed protein product [Protopolystoma xenopodis]